MMGLRVNDQRIEKQRFGIMEQEGKRGTARTRGFRVKT